MQTFAKKRRERTERAGHAQRCFPKKRLTYGSKTGIVAAVEKGTAFCRAALHKVRCLLCFSLLSKCEKKTSWRKLRHKNKNFFLTREWRRSIFTKCLKIGKIECFYKLFTICLQRLTEYIAENSKNCHFAVCALKEYLQVQQPLIGIIMQDDHKMLWFSQKCSPTGPKNR